MFEEVRNTGQNINTRWVITEKVKEEKTGKVRTRKEKKGAIE